MDVLPLQFYSLKIAGLWPIGKEANWFIKYFWKPFNINVMFAFMFSQFTALVINRDNVKDAAECLFMSITFLTLNLKMINYLLRPKSLDKLLNLLRKDICIPRTAEEEAIMTRNKRPIIIIFSIYQFMAQFTGIAFGLVPLFDIIRGASLDYPYKIYEFYSKDCVAYFVITYAFQVWAVGIGIMINAPLDTFFCAFIMLVCGQIDICCHRLVNGCKEDVLKSVKECVQHHSLILQIIEQLSDFLMVAVIPFLFFSLFTICTGIYNLSQTGINNLEAIPLMMYIMCMSNEVFFYCWSGNELKLKSNTISDTIYNIDWTTFKPVERKQLYFIMHACQKDLSISYHGFCSISMEIYVWVVKTSYAAYNLLTSVSNEDK